MNLTVGPLPPAVYWRRRALVAGVLVLLILLIAYSCGGSSGSGATGQRSSAHTPTTSSPTPSEQRTQITTPTTGDPSPSVTGSTGAAPPAGAVDPASDLCADADIQLTPAVVRLANGTYKATLRIRNTSTRNCRRDVGSKPQELHVVQNGQTVWSSDSCQSGQGESNMTTLGAGIEYAYDVIWDGTSGAKCTGGAPLPPGGYQIVAKLDAKTSAPVNFTIAGK
jgi:hypothetical protein